MNQITASVLEFCKTKGASDAEICRIVGAKKDKVNNWRIGRSTPSVEELTMLAEHFFVSTDCVLGRADNPSRDTASPGEHWLVKAYNRASDDDKGIVNLALNKYREEAALETHMVKRAI